MAFFQMVGSALETVGNSVVAGVQLGRNEEANNAVKKSADKVATHAVTVGLDAGGFATSTVAPALEVAGHAISSTAIDCARVVTFDKNEDLRNASNHQKGKMDLACDKVSGGVKRLMGHEDGSFGMKSADLNYNFRHDWISQLPNEKLLSDIHVPGTHDSMALYGGDFAETQRMDLNHQLHAGIGKFDIRVRHRQDTLPIHHGVIFMRAHLDDVFERCKNFLTSYPNEVILARISTAGCANEGPHSCSFDEAVVNTAEKFNLKLVMYAMRMTLESCRGSVVWIKDQSMVECHDNWETVECKQKYDDVAAFARNKDFNVDTIKVNYTSGSGTSGMAYVTPAALATMVNTRILCELQKPHHPQIIMFDYPGQSLIDKVIQWNS